MRLSALVDLFIVGMCASPALASDAQVLKTIAVDNPAFLHIAPGKTAGTSELLISTFAFFGDSTIARLDLNTAASNGGVLNTKADVLANSIKWPNDITTVPDSVFGPGYASVGAGFLTPGYSTGQAAVVNFYTGETFSLSKPKPDYFYHRILWVDMNGDGRLDALTARAKKPIFGGTDGELVWFEQPANGAKGPWVEHVIAKGPDVYVATADLNHDGSMQILAAEFFGAKLSVLWQEGGSWKRRVIDDKIGAVFDLSLADLNNDGKLDLLVTNHLGDDRAGIFGYEIPQDFKTGEWKRHTLLSGIVTKVQGMNQAAPGSALAWQAAPGQKPYIVAAGDGSGQVHLLKPASQDASDWSYHAEAVLDTNSTIGKVALGTPRADGSTPLYVPAYDEGKIYVLKLEP